jgi:hypothetical protein
MVRLYKAQFFFPFAMEQGTYNRLSRLSRCLQGDWFQGQDDITPYRPKSFPEYQYCHPHARELLFGENKALRYLEVRKEKIDNWRVKIRFTRKDGEDKVVEVEKILRLDWVTALLYDLDIGVLSFGVSYDAMDHSALSTLDMADVLDINNLLRRSAPSFLSYGDIDQYGERPGDNKNGWSGAQKGALELPQEVLFLDESGNAVEETREDFGKDFDELFKTNGPASGLKPYIGRHFRFWLSKLAAAIGVGRDRLVAESILDERNFVTAFVIAEPKATQWEKGPFPDESARIKVVESKSNPYGTLEIESDSFRNFLYQLIYVDPSKNTYTANPGFRDKLLADALYLRYRDSGTIYGFTPYSGMYLTHLTEEGDWAPRNILVRHFDSMYFQMANLLLTYRAALLNLSQRSVQISQQVRTAAALERPDIDAKLEDLRADFLKFHNKYWFCELTGQQQGMEIMDLWNRQLGNDRLFKEVEQEVRALHDFAHATLNRRLGKLTYINISALFVAVLALGFAGLEVSPVGLSGWSLLYVVVGLLVGAGLSVLGVSWGWKFLDCFRRLEGWVRR